MSTKARTAWETSRGSRQERGYGRQHELLRKQLFAAEPLCRMCRDKGRVTVATIADHIVPLAKGGPRYDITNLQPLCPDHHHTKTMADQGKRAKVRIGLDGWPCDD